MSAARKASRRRRRPPFEGKEKWAIDGARTRDIQDHNLALYQLSYDRHMYRRGRNPGPGRLGPPGWDRQPAAAWRVPARAASQAPIRSSAASSSASALQKAKRA